MADMVAGTDQGELFPDISVVMKLCLLNSEA